MTPNKLNTCVNRQGFLFHNNRRTFSLSLGKEDVPFDPLCIQKFKQKNDREKLTCKIDQKHT